MSWPQKGRKSQGAWSQSWQTSSYKRRDLEYAASGHRRQIRSTSVYQSGESAEMEARTRRMVAFESGQPPNPFAAGVSSAETTPGRLQDPNGLMDRSHASSSNNWSSSSKKDTTELMVCINNSGSASFEANITAKAPVGQQLAVKLKVQNSPNA